MASDAAFDRWLASLEARHLADLRFPEVARALRALSSTYVERRERLPRGAALSGAGKRAAFALFYGPLHYLIVNHIAASLPLPGGCSTIVDLGCGTGAAGAACATALGGSASATVEPRAPESRLRSRRDHASYGAQARTPSPGSRRPDLIVGVDCHPWALTEAARTYREFGCKGRTEKADVASTPRLDLPRASERNKRSLFVIAFALNELTEPSRDRVMQRLIARAQNGDAVLIVEPLAGFVAPWWSRWAREIERAGGRADEWRARKALPGIVSKLDRAAGLDHRELTARTLYISVIKN